MTMTRLKRMEQANWNVFVKTNVDCNASNRETFKVENLWIVIQTVDEQSYWNVYCVHECEW